MKKERFDVLVMISAFVLGGYFSAVTNPILGVAFLIGVMSVWALIPKLPVMKQAKIKIDK